VRAIFLSLALLPLTASAAANPEPEWGAPIDPDKVGKFTFGKGSVTIEVPAGVHLLSTQDKKKFNAPRLLRSAKGDFDVQVRVRGEFRPSPRKPYKHGNAAGALLVVGGGKSPRVLRVLLHGTHNGEETGPFHYVVGSGGGGPTVSAFFPRDAHRVVKGRGGKEEWEGYLKVERRGDELRAYISPDGQKWSAPGEGRKKGAALYKIAGDARVGVAAMSLSAEKFKVTFDQFKLTPLKAGK